VIEAVFAAGSSSHLGFLHPLLSREIEMEKYEIKLWYDTVLYFNSKKVPKYHPWTSVLVMKYQRQ
jgi:hypothetical protein